MEIELKLLVAPADVRAVQRHSALRAVTQGPGRSQKLHTVYYDTLELDLSRAGIALRLRQAGSRWIQTLKGAGGSAAGMHERVELEWPVAGDTLDLTLLEATVYRKLFARARVREGLRPVFATVLTRSARAIQFADGTTAEFAIDQGEIRAGARTQPISEVEIELKRGDPTRLFELAVTLSHDVPLRLGAASKAERGFRLARGGTDTPQKARPVALGRELTTAAALRRITLACVAHMQANETGTLAGRNPEYLHQLRVGLRRLRSCLSLAKSVAAEDQLAPLVEELRWLGGALGPARDWDVFMTETLPPLAASFNGVPGFEAFRRRCQRLRAQHGRAARTAVASPRYRTLLLALGRAFARDDLAALRTADAVPEHPLDRPVSEFAAGVLERRDRRVRKCGESVPDALPAERHAVRVAAKKLRYAAEFFASLYGAKGVARYVEALQGLQDILGALNDAAVTDRLLAEAAGAAKTPIDPQVTGIVRGWFAAVALQQLGHFKMAWRAFDKQHAYWKEG